MAHAIKYHPGMALLEQFVEGTLSSDVALAVSAHIDLCPHCQRINRDMHQDFGSQFAKQSVKTGEFDWRAMMDAITAQPQQTQKHSTSLPEQQPLAVRDREFIVPRALQRLASEHGKWLNLGGISTAKLPTGGDYHVSLLYISKDTEVPQHTHLGMEMTLVLSGKIVDENGEYRAGDLLINSPDDTHTPRTMADEDCLCLSVLSAPLHFNKGLTRLLNPLQQFFY